jgi:hypothetical protein
LAALAVRGPACERAEPAEAGTAELADRLAVLLVALPA